MGKHEIVDAAWKAREERALAQLGARVLEILRDQRLTAEGITRAARATNARAADAGWLALDAARSLGLLGEDKRP